ncbi:MAG: amidohydrolase family protein [Lentisphaeria bacterium]
MPIFDAHTHVFPDAIAARVVAEIAGSASVTPSFDGTRTGLEALLKRTGIDGALNCPIATRPEQVPGINARAIAGNRWPVLSLGTVHQATPEPARVLEELHAAGVPGIKLHPEYQGFDLDDPRLTPVWAACVRLGLVVVMHGGEDIAFTPPCHGSPAAIRDLLAAHPGLKLVAAHFGGWRQWAGVRQMLLGKPLWLDLSFTFDYVPDADIVEMIRRHGVARVLFASDAPWADPAAVLAAVRRLPLTPAERDAILWDNAAALFGLRRIGG